MDSIFALGLRALMFRFLILQVFSCRLFLSSLSACFILFVSPLFTSLLAVKTTKKVNSFAWLIVHRRTYVFDHVQRSSSMVLCP